MGTINLINGGLDVQGIVDQLVYVERASVRSMQSRASRTQSKVTAFQAVNTRLSTLLNRINSILFNETSNSLTTPYSFEDRLAGSVFAALAARSSDENLITAAGGKGIASGSFAISISSLARAQTSASGNFADITSELQTGTLSIRVGTGEAVEITIDDGNNTLEGIRSAINAADAGVTATIINDGTAGTPYRLLVAAEDTGTANAFTITPSLSGAGQPLSFTVANTAADAAFKVNGIDIIKSTNTVSDVIDGVTLNLKSVTAADVTVTVESDLDKIVSALKDLASAYNDANSYINTQYQYNTETRTAGVLSGDPTLRAVQGKIRELVTQPVSNSYTRYSVLSQAGVEFNRDGSLTINESDLREALAADPAGVAALFLGHGTPPEDGMPGIEGTSPIVNLRTALRSVTDPLSGPIQSATDGLNNTIRELNSQIDAYEDRLEVRRDLLLREFSKADQALRLLGVTQSSLSAQVGSLGVF